ncbi:MAG: CopG family ribbon-helix-helix protein [Desulfurococcaceae archaeon]|nr:CopG family ribbon-helix-helix protein [Desulfurococcaceae archaeon]
MSGRKVGIYIPSELEQQLRVLIEKRGISNISQAVQKALRLYLSEISMQTACIVTGSITILYNHEIGDIDSVLTDLQHEFMDIVLFATHIHLDREKCLLTIAVKGPSERVEEFTSRITNLRGVLLVKPTILCVS